MIIGMCECVVCPAHLTYTNANRIKCKNQNTQPQNEYLFQHTHTRARTCKPMAQKLLCKFNLKKTLERGLQRTENVNTHLFNYLFFMIIKLYLNKYKTYEKCETRIQTPPSKARTATDAHKHAAHCTSFSLFLFTICSKKWMMMMICQRKNKKWNGLFSFSVVLSI